jgi:hypothetical protein
MPWWMATHVGCTLSLGEEVGSLTMESRHHKLNVCVYSEFMCKIALLWVMMGW